MKGSKRNIDLKIPNLDKTACQNLVAMETSSHVIEKHVHKVEELGGSYIPILMQRTSSSNITQLNIRQVNLMTELLHNTSILKSRDLEMIFSAFSTRYFVKKIDLDLV